MKPTYTVLFTQAYAQARLTENTSSLENKVPPVGYRYNALYLSFEF